MFDDCYLRIGRGPLVGCVPLTVPLLSSIYALPARSEVPLRAVLDTVEGDQPWSASFAVAPEQTAAAAGAMLRELMLGSPGADPGKIDLSTLPPESRAYHHLHALCALWSGNPGAIPGDISTLADFLTCEANDALHTVALIRDRNDPRHGPLERAVLERLESHHGVLDAEDSDIIRLIVEPRTASAPEETLAGHVQRRLLDPTGRRVPADDSLAVLAVRDSLTECETAAATIQHWLACDASLKASDIGVILPAGGDYASYLGDSLARAGLIASSLPAAPARRNIGAEAVLHFVQCRRRPAPAMALASLFCSPVLCWDAALGNRLARSAMEGNFSPEEAYAFTGNPARLFALIRANSPATNAQLKEQLREFHRLLSTAPVLEADVREAKVQIVRLIAELGSAADAVEPDWDKVIQFAAAYQALPAARGAYHLGGISVMLAHEAPARQFRKLLVLGFNEGCYPASPSGNPFFLDSEVALIREKAGLELPSQASQLQTTLDLFVRQLRAASEQVLLLLSERDRAGAALAPSSSLPLIARLVEGCEDPERIVVPLSRADGTIWGRLITWQPRPEFKSAIPPEIPVHFELGLDLLALRRKSDGSPAAQSPSRLEKLLVSPLAWLLAELGASHVPWQPEGLDVMLRGSLAHEVFERLFLPGRDHPGDASIEEQVPNLLQDRIRALAPFLQGPVWAVERTALQAEIVSAAKHWSRVLTALGAEIVGNEFWLAGSLFGHPIHGKADCLLRLPDGELVVVDYKKSSSGTRRKRLEQGWDLQVDLYRKMDCRIGDRSTEDEQRIAATLAGANRRPSVAYHTLNDGNVLLNGLDQLDSGHVEVLPGEIAVNALKLIEIRFKALKAGQLHTNSIGDEKFFRTAAALGTYAFEDSPLVAAFMRPEEAPSVEFEETGND